VEQTWPRAFLSRAEVDYLSRAPGGAQPFGVRVHLPTMDVSRPAPGCCKGLSRQQSCYRSAPKLHAASADATFGHRCCYMPRPLCYKVHDVDATRGHRQCYLRPPPLLHAATTVATRSMAPMLPVATAVATKAMAPMLHTLTVVATRGHGARRCYMRPPLLLLRAAAIATCSHRRCYSAAFVATGGATSEA
jgi:hypothetical protein